ncbi:MAG: 4Fe-4S dicluster domain-containing protein [Geobacteraceae bacterium]|nr:4Fe-4S dicluster domain-containing protein [Geobacteraceae bacterium]
MAKDFLPIGSIPDFLDALATFGEVHGPLLTDDGVQVFGRIASPADLRLDYRRTLLPPKKYLLPPRETVLTYAPDSGYRPPPLPDRDIILLALHPCDLAGIAYLDMAFTSTEPDPWYRARRRRLTLIGLSCEPDEFCFCAEVGAATPGNFDLFLERTPAGFHIRTGSRRGEKILARLARLLGESEPALSSPQRCNIESAILVAVRRGETFPYSPLWDEFASRCLSCGACSLCCPTCYCFDVREYGLLDGESAERIREWDNCLFMAHGETAGGFNFRKNRRERFLYRYRHKYLGFGPTRGTLSCVGCGRCREVCPVRIDLLELFKEER